MASLLRPLSVALLSKLLLLAAPAFSADSPEYSPSPAPQLPPEATSPPPASPSPSPAKDDSLPAPPPSDLAPSAPSPALSPGANADDAPAPAPDAADVSHSDLSNVNAKHESSDDMSGGKKEGIAIGVIGAACIAGVGVVVYKKRQQNIQRSQYGNAARREFL